MRSPDLHRAWTHSAVVDPPPGLVLAMRPLQTMHAQPFGYTAGSHLAGSTKGCVMLASQAERVNTVSSIFTQSHSCHQERQNNRICVQLTVANCRGSTHSLSPHAQDLPALGWKAEGVGAPAPARPPCPGLSELSQQQWTSPMAQHHEGVRVGVHWSHEESSSRGCAALRRCSSCPCTCLCFLPVLWSGCRRGGVSPLGRERDSQAVRESPGSAKAHAVVRPPGSIPFPGTSRHLPRRGCAEPPQPQAPAALGPCSARSPQPRAPALLSPRSTGPPQPRAPAAPSPHSAEPPQ